MIWIIDRNDFSENKKQCGKDQKMKKKNESIHWKWKQIKQVDIQQQAPKRDEKYQQTVEKKWENNEI